MWLGILLSLTLTYGLARIIVNAESEQIIQNWKDYRCNPSVLLFAGEFKNKDDPRTSFAFTSDNFEFCASELAKEALNVALKPVLDVFYQMSSAAIQSIGFTMNLRTLGSNLFNGLNRMFDVFARRFNLTFHELNLSFLKQFSAIQKANAIAIASVYSGISVIRGIMNAFQLMITVVISILIILIVLVIFLFFILAPVIPLIIVAISVIAATASAGAVGGMSDSFCFGPETLIATSNGIIPIKNIQVGDLLMDGSSVTAIMKFINDDAQLFSVDGIVVSGSHLVYDNDVPIFVKDYKDAVPFLGTVSYLYCLNTSNKRIPVQGFNKTVVFADWEELDDDSMIAWDEFVQIFLNGSSKDSDNTALGSESGFAKETLVRGLSGYVTIGSLKCGSIIYDGTEWTEVIGLVTIDGSETDVFGKIDSSYLSGATWINESGVWIRANKSPKWVNESPVNNLYSVFTKSGKIQLDTFTARDFSDIGLDKINTSYSFTLSRLQKC